MLCIAALTCRSLSGQTGKSVWKEIASGKSSRRKRGTSARASMRQSAQVSGSVALRPCSLASKDRIKYCRFGSRRSMAAVVCS